MGEHVAAYRRKRDMIVEGLSDLFEITMPGGAFYVYPRVPHSTGTDFVARAIENNLLIIPGNVFSEADTHFRISYATSNDKISQGLDILNSIV